jgi:hypothetical protein
MFLIMNQYRKYTYMNFNRYAIQEERGDMDLEGKR